MELKSVKNGVKNWLTFLFDLTLASEALFEPKMEPKWLHKSTKNTEAFLNDFGHILEGFWEHSGSQKVSQIE